MAAPDTHKVVLQPPAPGMERDPRELYKFLYELWQRTGTYKSNNPDLGGLTASVAELNTLAGINTGDTVQEQLDGKQDSDELGTMAFQDANTVAITGGQIEAVQISESVISIPAGTGGATVLLNGTLDVNTTQTGNIGSGEDTLISYTMAGDTLNDNNQFVEVKSWGTFAANANNKRIKFKLGGTTLLDTGTVAANSGSWLINATIVRTNSSSEQVIASITSSNTLVTESTTYTEASEDVTTNLNIFCTGEAISNDDIIQKGQIIKWFNT